MAKAGAKQSEKIESKEAAPIYPLTYADKDGNVRLWVDETITQEYAELVKEWKQCEKCPLHATRNEVTFVRGILPATVLFIGEAPGPKEDELGFPFVGPSGRLLTSIINELRKSRTGWSYAITTPIGCVPWERTENDQDPYAARNPEENEIEKCNPRFTKLLALADPQGIILLGKVAEKFWADYGPKTLALLADHYDRKTKPRIMVTRSPSYLLRQGGAREGNAEYRNVLSGLKQFLFQTLNVGKE